MTDRSIPPAPSTLAGIAWMILSCLCFAIVWAMIRIASDQVSAFMIIFFRTFVGALALMPNYFRDGWSFLQTERLGVHAIRGFTAITATFGIFYAVTVAPLSLVVAISYAAPLFTTLGAVLVFKESIRARRITALVVGFLGMLLVLRPDQTVWSIGVVSAIVGTLGIAASMLTIKALAPTDQTRTIVAYAFLMPLPVTFAVALPDWTWPDSQTLLLLLAIGLIASVGQFALAKSFAKADASAVLPFDFVRLLAATALGALLFDEALELLTLVGAVVILGASVYLAHRERLAQRRSDRSAKLDRALDARQKR